MPLYTLYSVCCIALLAICGGVRFSRALRRNSRTSVTIYLIITVAAIACTAITAEQQPEGVNVTLVFGVICATAFSYKYLTSPGEPSHLIDLSVAFLNMLVFGIALVDMPEYWWVSLTGWNAVAFSAGYAWLQSQRGNNSHIAGYKNVRTPSRSDRALPPEWRH